MSYRYIHEGGRYKSPYEAYGDSSHSFYKWRIYLTKNGWIRADYIGKYNSRCSGFELDFLFMINFNNESQVEIYKETFKALIKKQYKKFPDIWKSQKTEMIQRVNYFKKYHKFQYEKPITQEWLNEMLPIIRKRKP